jgi:hypothetical protein
MTRGLSWVGLLFEWMNNMVDTARLKLSRLDWRQVGAAQIFDIDPSIGLNLLSQPHSWDWPRACKCGNVLGMKIEWTPLRQRQHIHPGANEPIYGGSWKTDKPRKHHAGTGQERDTNPVYKLLFVIFPRDARTANPTSGGRTGS